MFKSPIAPHTHNYKNFPYTLICEVTDGFGNHFQTQILQRPEKTHKTIYSGDTTIVILQDGSKGIAKRHPDDPWNKEIAHGIAFARAAIKSYEKQIQNYKNGIVPEINIQRITK